MGKMDQLKEAKKKLKDMGISAKDLSNPAKLLDQVQGTDTVKQMNAMAKGIEDGIMMLQEHIMIVQKNQVHFQDYFKGMYKKMEELEKQFTVVEKEVSKTKKEVLYIQSQLNND